MREALLEVRGLTRSFYGVRALAGVDFDVRAGTITALIGPNGAGKTTTFGCISGVVPPEAGRVRLAGLDITGWRPDRITGAGLRESHVHDVAVTREAPNYRQEA